MGNAQIIYELEVCHTNIGIGVGVDISFGGWRRVNEYFTEEPPMNDILEIFFMVQSGRINIYYTRRCVVECKRLFGAQCTETPF